jgi:hypothetical protein
MELRYVSLDTTRTEKFVDQTDHFIVKKNIFALKQKDLA